MKIIGSLLQDKISRGNVEKSGFTVVELIIVITVSGLLMSSVLFTLGNFYEDSLTSIATSTQEKDVKSALATISSDLKDAIGFRASFTIPTASPQPPLGSSNNATAGGNWSYCGTNTTSTTCDGVTDITTANNSSKRVLIAYVDATDGPTTSTTFNPVFLNNGTFSLPTATRATNAYIYFVAPDRGDSSINNLYRRTIINVDPTNNTDLSSNALYDCSVPIGQNPSITNCSSTTSLDSKSSCASTVVASNSAFCTSSDAILLRDVESFWIDYYYSNNQSIADDYTSNATTVATVVSNINNNAKSVRVTVTKKPSGSAAKRSIASTRIINGSTVSAAVVPTDGSFMQTISSANCPSTRIRAVDARDSHTYWVQKLSDGKCWMLTNLGYAGGGTNTYNDIDTLTNGTGLATTYTTASYYVVPTTTNFTSEPTQPSTATNGTGQYGYLYNFCGAMAGQATSACANSTTPAPDSTSTICPYGWRLPVGGATGDFVALNTAVNGSLTNTDSGLITTWLGQRSGYANGTSGFSLQGSNGYYWDSTVPAFATQANILTFGSTIATPDTNSGKNLGFAVRCIAN